MTPMTRNGEDTSTLYVALELSAGKWKLAFARELAAPPRIRTVEARALKAVEEEIQAAKRHLGLPESCRVMTCYEAGRDGFWLHRWLVAEGFESLVVDPASIEVERRARKRKTDRIDAIKLLTRLIRHAWGERVWKVVRVPTEEEEDGRRLHRERERLVCERGQHQARIRALLATQGIQSLKVEDKALELRRHWDGAPLPERLRHELAREMERLKVIRTQLKAVEKEIEGGADQESRAAQATRQLRQLKAIGMVGAQILGYEFFGWRKFTNGRQVGALAGLTGTPHQSGSMAHEQGISKAGNRRVRGVMCELSWIWLRYQPDSALTQWYRARFGSGPGRLRRIGIVALARKLLVALWRFVDQGVVPEGAILRSAA
jgi:transposase